jgi:predicted HTH domain antitoxin
MPEGVSLFGKHGLVSLSKKSKYSDESAQDVLDEVFGASSGMFRYSEEPDRS